MDVSRRAGHCSHGHANHLHDRATSRFVGGFRGRLAHAGLKEMTMNATKALLALVALAGPAVASEWATTEPAVANCVPYFMEDSNFDGLANHDHGLVNYGDNSIALTCSITSSAGLFDATTLDGVQVLAYDGHSGSSVSSQMCISNPTTGSLTCSTLKTSGSSVVGAVAIWHDAPTVSYGYYTASVYVRLPAEQCTDSGILGCDAHRYSRLRSYNVWRD
jgi:hypothetical protein